MYDGVLKLCLPRGVKFVSFEDDLVLLVIGDSLEEVELLATVAISVVEDWMCEKNFALAHHKIDLVLINNRKAVHQARISVGECIIDSKREGVIDNRLSFDSHIDYACGRAEKVILALSRIMPNNSAISSNKKRLLVSVSTSVLRYAGPDRDLMIRSRLNSTLRLMAMRASSAYRTISSEAAYVIAGTISVNLLLEEVNKCYRNRGTRRARKRARTDTLLCRYEQGLEDYDEAAERLEREKKRPGFQQQYNTVVQPFLTLFNVVSSALSYGRSMGTTGFGLDRASILGTIRGLSEGSSIGAGNDQTADINSEKSTGNDGDADKQRENSTAVATVEGRYIKGDPLNGYYDFVISEGSYKFWAVFQVATAILIIYSTFAAIYYSKVSPLTSDYDYIDYLNGGRSFAGARPMSGASDPWDRLLSKPWFNVATRSFGFVMDAIERVPK
ncbi:uncharacterized protein LOC131679526 [Topomyia yanbarensis]|uniref:uncharacterized protein LOC131679526 n=1 Tax=Topomyia yanbarensis TaxID=2498891 RepID=UPI00273B443B|nr:uncharacterized protein LOC131679526 [Topomyia yanbarensis]